MALNLAYKKTRLYKTLDYRPRDMLNFVFLEKGMGIVSAPHFVHDFSRKMLPILYSISWPNFIFSLYLLFEILGNMYTAIVYFPVFNTINFEINLIFLINSFFYMTKKSRQKFKYLENEKSF